MNPVKEMRIRLGFQNISLATENAPLGFVLTRMSVLIEAWFTLQDFVPISCSPTGFGQFATIRPQIGASHSSAR